MLHAVCRVDQVQLRRGPARALLSTSGGKNSFHKIDPRPKSKADLTVPCSTRHKRSYSMTASDAKAGTSLDRGYLSQDGTIQLKTLSYCMSPPYDVHDPQNARNKSFLSWLATQSYGIIFLQNFDPRLSFILREDFEHSHHISGVPDYVGGMVQCSMLLMSNQIFPNVNFHRAPLVTGTLYRDIVFGNVIMGDSGQTALCAASVLLDPPPQKKPRAKTATNQKIRQHQLKIVNDFLRLSPTAIMSGNFEFNDDSVVQRDLQSHIDRNFEDVFAHEQNTKKLPTSHMVTRGSSRIDRVFFRSRDASLSYAACSTFQWMGSRCAKDVLEQKARLLRDCGHDRSMVELSAKINAIPEPFGVHSGLEVIYSMRDELVNRIGGGFKGWAKHHVRNTKQAAG